MVLSTFTRQKICKEKCGLLLTKCRHLKKNRRFDCFYFRKKAFEYLEELEKERMDKELSKRSMYSMAQDDFFDAMGDDISKKEFYDNEMMYCR